MRYGNACQRRRVAGGKASIRGLGCAERALAIARKKSIQMRIERVDAIEERGRQLDAGQTLRRQRLRELGNGSGEHAFYSMTFGTRYNPLCTAGATLW